jgi:hypothetical protein
MAEVKIHKERMLGFRIEVFPGFRESGFPARFFDFRKALKISLRGIAKNFDFDLTEDGNGVIRFCASRKNRDFAEEKLAKLQKKYFRKK